MSQRQRVTVRATHQYVPDPDVAATMDVWVKMLVRVVRNQKPVAAPPDAHLAAPPGKAARPTR